MTASHPFAEIQTDPLPNARAWTRATPARVPFPGGSAMLFCLRGGAKPAQPVERSLENECGRHPIDRSRALGTRDVLRDQRTGDGHGRKPFIPKDARAR